MSATTVTRTLAAAIAAGFVSVAALSGVASAQPSGVAGLGPGPYVEVGASGSQWRAAPSTASYVVKEFSAGVKVNVDCRTRGDFVRIPGGKRWTNVWYRFAFPIDGGRMYVSAAQARVTSPEQPYDCAGLVMAP